MLCPLCHVQCRQFENRGGGISRDDYYETWEIKECPSCFNHFREFYSVRCLLEETVVQEQQPKEDLCTDGMK